MDKRIERVLSPMHKIMKAIWIKKRQKYRERIIE